MDNLIQKSLLALGLDSKEIKFYEAVFRRGPSSINQIAKQSHLQRSTAYLTAQSLFKKGFLEEDQKLKRKIIFAVNPSIILRKLSYKQRLFRRQEIELEEGLPELLAKYKDTDLRPQVRVYEGKRGLLQILNDILETKEKVIYWWTNQETEQVGSDTTHEKFIQERITRQIRIKVLAVDNNKAYNLMQKDQTSFRETKLLPKNVHFTTETYIYDNKVAVLDYTKDIIGVITESQPITSFQREIFNNTWLGIK